MWKRLSRLWKKNADALDEGEHAQAPAVAPVVAGAEVEGGEAVSDGERAIALALERFDREHDDIGPEAVVGRIRELVLTTPTDARVLRRAAALLRELGDDALAAGFEQAARVSSGEPLAELGHAFLGMDDAELALALGDGAVSRARERGRRGRGRVEAADERGGDQGLGEGLLVGALALSRLGEHQQVLERLEGVLDTSVAVRVRWALGALALGESEAFARVSDALEEATDWIEAVRARVTSFPVEPIGPRNDPQRLLFALYGAILLDDADEGERLDAARLLRWLQSPSTLVRELLPAGTRPAWVSPRGEVLARWLASLLPDEGAMPLSARLPKQPVLVVLADDADLALLAETRAWAESELPIFQALKDPGEIGSPMADIVGVFRDDVTLPLEALEAERAADRVPPRMLVGRLQDEASKSGLDPAELDGFLTWARARASHLSVVGPPRAEDRIPLDVAREI